MLVKGCSSNCGPWTSGISGSWELINMWNLSPSPNLLNQNLHFSSEPWMIPTHNEIWDPPGKRTTYPLSERGQLIVVPFPDNYRLLYGINLRTVSHKCLQTSPPKLSWDWKPGQELPGTWSKIGNRPCHHRNGPVQVSLLAAFTAPFRLVSTGQN